MSLAAVLRAGLARRDWPLAHEPDAVLNVVAVCGTAGCAAACAALAQLHGTGRQWTVLAVLAVLALVVVEIGHRIDSAQVGAGTDFRRDQLSVWSIAGAIVMTPGQAVLLLAGVCGYLWLRLQRPAGELGYRAVCRASVALLGCLGASVLVSATAPAWSGAPARVADLLAVLVALVGYAALTHGLQAVGLLTLGGRGAAVVGSADQPLAELARLCLGGLVAYLAVSNPELTVLAVAPMVALQRGRASREVEAAAMFDAKTGLLNALAWEQLTRRELIRGRRASYPVAVLLIDIDRFKQVNDRLGHLAGDAVLRAVAGALAQGVRTSDAVGRFGGEEFVVVLPNAGSREALRIAERLRARISDVQVAAHEQPRVSASIGVACAPRDGDELAELLRAADAALYRAKEHGRNRVLLAERGRAGPYAQPPHN